MTLSDVAAREIAKALRKHVGIKELERRSNAPHKPTGFNEPRHCHGE